MPVIRFIPENCTEKIKIIKTVRACTGLGLKESKDCVDGVCDLGLTEPSWNELCRSFRQENLVHSSFTEIIDFSWAGSYSGIVHRPGTHLSERRIPLPHDIGPIEPDPDIYLDLDTVRYLRDKMRGIEVGKWVAFLEGVLIGLSR